MWTIFNLLFYTCSIFIFKRNITSNSNSKKGLLYKGIPLAAMGLWIIISSTNHIILCIGMVLCVGSIFIVHSVIGKFGLWDENTKSTKKMIVFLVDQCISIGSIIVVTKTFPIELNEFFYNIYSTGSVTYTMIGNVFIVLYASFSGAEVVPYILECIYKGVDNYVEKMSEISNKGQSDDSSPQALTHEFEQVKTGRIIGILERMLMLIFLCLNQLSLIGFIIAIKSLCRFKLMENKTFAEYYLIGTMLSLVYTFIAYIGLQILLDIIRYF